jgi:hypothetical protein
MSIALDVRVSGFLHGVAVNVLHEKEKIVIDGEAANADWWPVEPCGINCTRETGYCSACWQKVRQMALDEAIAFAERWRGFFPVGVSLLSHYGE